MQDQQQRPGLLHLFSIFFRVGAFTFGGGFAMIPIMQRELVDRQGWLRESDFIDMIGLTQSAPGPVAINSAVYLGYRLRGFAGALVATLATALPSLLTILAIAWALDRYSLDWLNRAFAGIRPTVVALIAYAAYALGRKTLVSPPTWAIAAATVLSVSAFAFHPALVIGLGVVAGFALRQRLGGRSLQ